MTAFEVQGKTVTFTGATVAPTAVQALSINDVRSPQFLLTNTSTTTGVFVSWAQNSAQAIAQAVIPTATPQFGYYLLPGSQVVITAPPETFFTGITAAGTAVVYICCGYGV